MQRSNLRQILDAKCDPKPLPRRRPGCSLRRRKRPWHRRSVPRWSEGRTRQNYAPCSLSEHFYDFSTTSTETQRLRESQCPYCRSELPGLQTLCQKCWEKNYASPGSAKPWRPGSLPRLTRGNILFFLFLFAFCFLQGRFHIPFFYLHAPMSTKASGLIALLFASFAVYIQGDR